MLPRMSLAHMTRAKPLTVIINIFRLAEGYRENGRTTESRLTEIPPDLRKQSLRIFARERDSRHSGENRRGC